MLQLPRLYGVFFPLSFSQDHILEERRLLMKLDHPFILKLHDSFQDDRSQSNFLRHDVPETPDSRAWTFRGVLERSKPFLVVTMRH